MLLSYVRTNDFKSFVRTYDNNIQFTSMEIAIHSYNHKAKVFSARGDSGFVIADVNGRIVGMLTGGAGLTDSTDVTYASSYYLLNEEDVVGYRMRLYFVWGVTVGALSTYKRNQSQREQPRFVRPERSWEGKKEVKDFTIKYVSEEEISHLVTYRTFLEQTHALTGILLRRK
jgi:hypothetical protein